jgi:penicillin amidase
MRRILKWVGIGAGGLVLLALIGLAGGYLLLRNTVPSPSGTMAVAGLAHPVEVVRDREAVPHIFAKTIDDLYMALGFVHAQDRLWQMELQRRTGQARLSEVFGERTFTTDVFLRTLDLYGHSQRSVAALPPEAKAAAEAYARGVNAYINRDIGWLEPRLPPEFLFLRHRPEPWTVADSLVIAKLMALQLSTNLNFEMLRLILAAQGLTSAEIEDLMPLDPADAPPPMPEIAQLYPLKTTAPQKRADASTLIDEVLGSGASNNWVVSGPRTVSGKPLLANDPHLRLAAPAIWYLAHLSVEQPGGAANVVGASLPGVPGLVLGRADSLAWGFTNTGSDVQDLFIEKINPDNPREYLTPQGWRAFDVQEMAIAVKGAGVRKVERRRTRHGPVLPGFYRNLDGMLGAGYVAALQWTALTDDDTTLAAGLFDPNTRTVDDYFKRMRQFIVPMQSMVVADTAGRIGMIAPGRVPIRAPENRIAGRAPVPGWDAAYDWKGFIPVDDVPRVDDPNIGAVGTANARIVDVDYR